MLDTSGHNIRYSVTVNRFKPFMYLQLNIGYCFWKSFISVTAIHPCPIVQKTQESLLFCTKTFIIITIRTQSYKLLLFLCKNVMNTNFDRCFLYCHNSLNDTLSLLIFVSDIAKSEFAIFCLALDFLTCLLL